MPSAKELIAYNRNEEEIAEMIGADWLIYQDLDDLIQAVSFGEDSIKDFDLSCFNGEYVTGDVSMDYLERLDSLRNDSAKAKRQANA